MRAACAQIRSAVILAPLVLFTFQPPLLAGVVRSDSQEVATLLEQASDEARELAVDAEDLQILIVSYENWLTHTLKLAKSRDMWITWLSLWISWPKSRDPVLNYRSRPSNESYPW